MNRVSLNRISLVRQTISALVAMILTGAMASSQSLKTGPTAADDAPRRTHFETDPRLEAPMTVQSPAYAQRRLWQGITRNTKTRIERHPWARDLDDVPVCLAGNAVSARALMDAAAARVLARWEWTDRNAYRLLSPEWELDEVFGAQSEEERERFQSGREFIRVLNALPADERASLESGNPVSFASLPPGMRIAVGAMLDPLVREQKKKGWEVFPAERINEASLRLGRLPATEFDRLFLTLKVPGGNGAGFRINDYETRKQDRDAARQGRQRAGKPGKPEDLDDLYVPKRFEVSPEQAKRLPTLKRLVTLDGQNVSFPDVLLLLYKQYGIPFVSDPKIVMPQRADVHLSSMPLGEALDRLTEIYKDTEWEWRKYGVLVVRGPSNGARHPKQQ